PIARRQRLRERIAALGDEAGHDTVEGRPVVEPLAGELDEVLHGLGRVDGEELERDLAALLQRDDGALGARGRLGPGAGGGREETHEGKKEDTARHGKTSGGWWRARHYTVTSRTAAVTSRTAAVTPRPARRARAAMPRRPPPRRCRACRRASRVAPWPAARAAVRCRDRARSSPAIAAAPRWVPARRLA